MRIKQTTKEDTANRKQILNTARKLYYDRGMDAVSFDEIAEICGVTKSLIRYHFGSKALLANELFGTYSREQANVFFEKAYLLKDKYSHYEILSAYSIMSWRYYCKDEKALRFYTQLFSCSFTEITYGTEDMYKIFSSKAKDIDADFSHMAYIGSQYAARGLIYHFATGEIKCSEEVFDRFMLRQAIGYFLNEDDFESLLKNAYKILSQIKIDFLPEFVWK